MNSLDYFFDKMANNPGPLYLLAVLSLMLFVLILLTDINEPFDRHKDLLYEPGTLMCLLLLFIIVFYFS